MIKLSTLLNSICYVPPSLDSDISGLSLDSRLVKPGDLFFACQGTHLDGRAFIDDAIKRGANAVIAEAGDLVLPADSPNDKHSCAADSHVAGLKTVGSHRVDLSTAASPVLYVKNLSHSISQIAARFYDYPANALKIIGVTGTNGKTSCTHFIAEILKQLDLRCGIIGTLGNGLYGSVQPGNLTTPDAITVQKNLNDFRHQGAAYAAMEVSSHSLEQGRVDSIPFTVGVFTNLTRDHLDYHGSMEAYGNAKKKLFTQLPPLYSVINADDEFGRQLIQALAPHQKVYAYSALNPSPFLNAAVEQINVDEVQLDHTGIRASVFTPWGKGEFHTRLIGQFNVSNVLAVLTTLCLLDIPLPVVLNGLSHLQPVPGRMQTFGGGAQPLVVVDYAHSPDALEKVLSALRSHCRQRLHCVFGCGGDRDRGKRPLMAKAAEKWADSITVTDDNPRSEDPQQIVRDIMHGFDHSGTIAVQHDRANAIRDAILQARPGDCILIAGKGAEMYQQIGDKKNPFNDAEEVKKGLLEKH